MENLEVLLAFAGILNSFDAKKRRGKIGGGGVLNSWLDVRKGGGVIQMRTECNRGGGGGLKIGKKCVRN